MDNQTENIPQPVEPTLPQHASSNLSFLKSLAYGFSLVSFGIAIGVIGSILTTNKNQPVSQNQQVVSPTTQPSPTIDPTMNWKIYTNKTGGYELNYPPSWTVTEEDNQLYGLSITLHSNQTFPVVPNDPEPITYWININSYKNPNHKEFKELVTADLSPELKRSFTYSTEVINGYTAMRTTSLPSQAGCEWVFFKEGRNDNYLGFNFCLYDPQKPFIHQDEFYRIFNQILSTFKFSN